jgi:hypothetical protein
MPKTEPLYTRISPADFRTGTQRSPQPSELSKEFGSHTIRSCAEYTRQEEVMLEAFWAEKMI